MSIIIESLIAARDSLTTENWNKRAYLQWKDESLCFCAHGALQAQMNPIVKDLIEKEERAEANAKAFVAVNKACSKIFYEPIDCNSFGFWNKRPSYIKGDAMAESHYLLGTVGLTIAFNDSETTTLSMVKEKFNDAIDLAKDLHL